MAFSNDSKKWVPYQELAKRALMVVPSEGAGHPGLWIIGHAAAIELLNLYADKCEHYQLTLANGRKAFTTKWGFVIVDDVVNHIDESQYLRLTQRSGERLVDKYLALALGLGAYAGENSSYIRDLKNLDWDEIEAREKRARDQERAHQEALKRREEAMEIIMRDLGKLKNDESFMVLFKNVIHFDWWSEYSDDHRVWRAASEREVELVKALDEWGVNGRSLFDRIGAAQRAH